MNGKIVGIIVILSWVWEGGMEPGLHVYLSCTNECDMSHWCSYSLSIAIFIVSVTAAFPAMDVEDLDHFMLVFTIKYMNSANSHLWINYWHTHYIKPMMNQWSLQSEISQWNKLENMRQWQLSLRYSTWNVHESGSNQSDLPQNPHKLSQ